jgi:hypothetical protein
MGYVEAESRYPLRQGQGRLSTPLRMTGFVVTKANLSGPPGWLQGDSFRVADKPPSDGSIPGL